MNKLGLVIATCIRMKRGNAIFPFVHVSIRVHYHSSSQRTATILHAVNVFYSFESKSGL